jgi:fructosamine-3-kinase
MMWIEIAAQISQAIGKTFEISNRRPVGGGCINQGYAVSGNIGTYFVKLNQASQIEMFEAEALGLKQMLETQTIRVPKPLCSGIAGDSAYIAMEWLEFGGSGNTKAWEEMGRKLAAMHQANSPQPALNKGEGKKAFGWNCNNTIGSTPQINTWTSDWVEFFTEHRLGYQFQLARRRGGHFPLQDKLLASVETLLNHQPQPSLVHGDLWGGNAAITTSGEPVILDPATYVGDREVDIAMTELFGGFPAAFYHGYNEVWSLDDGYKQRKTVYNLYHILNHFNLFGGGYASQANRMIEQVLSYV